jgi:nitronate monooxygenase
VHTRAYDVASDAPFPPTIGQRVLRNEFTDRWHGHEDEVVARRPELQAELVAAWQNADARRTPINAGSGAGLIHDIQPAGEILRRLVADAERILRQRTAALLAPPL